MKCATMVLIVLCTLLASTSPSPADPPTTQPAASPEAQYPGRTQIARWDVILNETGMETIRDLGLAEVKTKSIGYEAYLSDGAALRGAVVQAAATNGVEKYSRFMVLHSGDMQVRATFMTQYGGSSLSPINGNAVGQGTMFYGGIGDNRIHLRADFPSINNQFMLSGQALNSPSCSISFDSDLDVGSALVLVTHLTDPSNVAHYHMIVWEAFKARSWQVNYFHNLRDSRWWCENGPDTLRAWSGAAAVWAAGAKHDPHTASPGFETKLEDGKTVHMLGATRSDSWPFCWWDGQGQPVALTDDQVYFGNQFKKEWCDIELIGAEGQTSRLLPISAPQPQTRPASHQIMLRYNEWMFTNTNSSEEVTFGVSVGPWTKIGQINIGGTIDFQNKTYSLNLMQDSGGVVVLSLSSGKDTENGDWITVTAVKKDGMELNPFGGRELTPKNFNISPVYFQGVSQADIQTFNVWTRKRKLITFKHIPYQPSPPPSTDVTPQQVAAAEAKLFSVQTAPSPPTTRPAGQ
jgi:hypothetical protein